MSGEVYLGHSPADRPYVKRVAEYLAARGVPTSFEPDESDVVAEYRIRNCAAFVPVLTPRSSRYAPLQRQAEHARDRGRTILSLVIEVEVVLAGPGATMIGAGEMPPESFVSRLRDLIRRFVPPVRPRPNPYAFLSYAHEDRSYVQKLAEHLESVGAKVWYDRNLDYSRSLPTQLEERIGGCAAMVPVLSRSSVRSDWVQCEIAAAKLYDRPILGLSLDGSTYLPLLNRYCENVRGAMPGPEFMTQIRNLTR